MEKKMSETKLSESKLSESAASPCTDCCIYPSCQRKYTKPKLCESKPMLDPKSNISTGISNIGRKRIAIGGGGNLYRQMELMEHRIRLGLCEGWE